MSRTNDIKNLFNRFGASTENYLEIESHYEYLEEMDVVLEGAVPVAPSAAIHAPHRTGSLPPVLQAMPTTQGPTDTTPPLRTLLDELNQARQVLDGAADKVLRARTDAKVIAMVSAKGGVGKSTLAASLTKILKSPDGRTLAVDLDPQNALAFQLGIDSLAPGLNQASREGGDWTPYCLTGHAYSHCLSFGPSDEDSRRVLERCMQDDPAWLRLQLANMNLSKNDVVIIDTPPGNTAYLSQVLETIDLALVVTMADGASYMALDAMQTWLQCAELPLCKYVINQVDSARQFSLDMTELLRRRLGDDLIATVHLDHLLSESQAYGRDPLEHSPDSTGCQDIHSFSRAVHHLLLTKPSIESVAS